MNEAWDDDGGGFSKHVDVVFDTHAGPAVAHGPQAEPDSPPLRAASLAAVHALVAMAAADGIAVELEMPATRERGWPASWPLPPAWFRVIGEGDAGLFGSDGSESAAEEAARVAEEAARVADTAHGEVVESLWPHRPTNWPPCPEHPTTHPLQLTPGDDADPRPLWTCPSTGDVIGPLGPGEIHATP
ncbi:hypothetical protein SAMN06264364_10629 [Quadrisphaera granulorum]|uniref:Uncharacterized protein n=1 Tax=Quadrisphaera granulorum TaxID=317664 RepID=A0A316A9I8_9ACTN|nr:hypothetical protein [Quadrisphaera granulorum]PWJ54586.1 hypothetical protein BXY45_10629 [Quadrisphaera granulorum]SZE95948.1 hypothetical protein SAMN06264364_10629 [Quadrisphaera granulorum]